MSAEASRTNNPRERALLALLRAIATRNRPMASQMLAESPLLAGQAVITGGTRETANAYFLKQIAHYIYAGDTPLHVAAAAYQVALAEELVSKGATTGARNRRGAEPLHYAADGSPGSDAWDPDAQRAMVEFLIGAGAHPNAKDKSGVAPLHRAVRTRCGAAVRALLENGADARGRNGNGSTPLHLAVRNTGRGASGTEAARAEQKDIIGLLLAHGARASDKDAAGRSARDSVKTDWIRALLGKD